MARVCSRPGPNGRPLTAGGGPPIDSARRELLQRPAVAVGVAERDEPPPCLIVDAVGLDADLAQVREGLVGIRDDDLDRVLLARLEVDAEAGAERDRAGR